MTYLGVCGWPVAHSRSPAMQNAALRATGLDGWEYLAPMVVVVVGVHAFSLVLRLVEAPGYIAIPAGVVVLFFLVAWKYYPSTLSGPFPTSNTWQFISADRIRERLQLLRDGLDRRRLLKRVLEVLARCEDPL